MVEEDIKDKTKDDTENVLPYDPENSMFVDDESLYRRVKSKRK